MLSFAQFWEKLSLQGLSYNPEELHYPGDGEMRVNTKKSKKARQLFYNGAVEKPKARRGRPRNDASPQPAKQFRSAKCTPSPTQYKNAKEKGKNPRLCGDLSNLTKHVASIERFKHERQCAFCGKPAYSRCMLCMGCPPLHFVPQRGENANSTCFFDYHNDVLFGMARDDHRILYGNVNSWKCPTI